METKPINLSAQTPHAPWSCREVTTVRVTLASNCVASGLQRVYLPKKSVGFHFVIIAHPRAKALRLRQNRSDIPISAHQVPALKLSCELNTTTYHASYPGLSFPNPILRTSIDPDMFSYYSRRDAPGITGMRDTISAGCEIY